MTAQQLKNSILQMAVQGKLVAQNPNDESAKTLLERIQKEKAQLVKDKRIKKDKVESHIFKRDGSYFETVNGVERCIDEELPFAIPESWEWCRLGSVSKLITKGSSPNWQGINYSSDGLLFITSENVGKEELLLENPKYIDVKFNDIQARSVLQCGDILTNIVGASIGRTAMYNLDKIANINQAVCLIRLISNEISSFLLKYLNSYNAYRIMLNDKVDTARANISLTNICDFFIPLPPLEEQKRIVAKIEEVLPHIQDYEKAHSKIETLNKDFPEKLKKSVLQWAVQGKLVAQNPNDESAKTLLERIQKEKAQLLKDKKIKKDKVESHIFKRDGSYFEQVNGVEKCIDEELPFVIPESWEWVRLGSVSKLIGGYAFKSTELTSVKRNMIRVIRISDFDNTGILSRNPVYCNYLDKLDAFKIDISDILIAMTGGTVGKSCLVENIPETMYVNQRVAKISSFNAISAKYLHNVISSDLTQAVINSQKNSTNDNISMDDISSFFIPFPPLSEQERIVAKIEEVLEVGKRF